jgi:hypothetical protein
MRRGEARCESMTYQGDCRALGPVLKALLDWGVKHGR